jgi:Arm domain-containing DNA-binding protein
MRGHIRRRGKDSWAIVIDLGRDANGKRRQKWHKVHGTKRKAQQELAALLHQMNTGAYVEPTNLRVSDYLDHWIKQVEPNLSAKTSSDTKRSYAST